MQGTSEKNKEDPKKQKTDVKMSEEEVYNYINREIGESCTAKILETFLRHDPCIMNVVREDTPLLHVMCKEIGKVSEKEPLAGMFDLLNRVIQKDQQADEAAKMSNPEKDNVMGCFRAARWYARNDQYPDEKCPPRLWAYWIRFDPVLSHTVPSSVRYIVLHFCRISKLPKLIKLPDWDVNDSLVDASFRGLYDHVKVLLVHNACVNHKNDLRETPLWAAAYNGHKNVAELLIQAGADIHLESRGKETPLSEAIRQGHAEIVDLFIKSGVDVEYKVYGMFSILTWAVVQGHIDVVKCALDNGADINKPTEDCKWTPLESAKRKGRTNIYNFLKEKGAHMGTKKE